MRLKEKKLELSCSMLRAHFSSKLASQNVMANSVQFNSKTFIMYHLWTLMLSWSHIEYHFGIKCNFLQSSLSLSSSVEIWFWVQDISLKSNVTFYRVFLSVPSPAEIWFLFHPYLFAISFPMSGLPFLQLNCFQQNLKNLSKKLEDLGSTGHKFDFLPIRTNVRSN